MFCMICDKKYEVDLMPDLKEILNLGVVKLCPECCMKIIDTRIQHLEYHLDLLNSAKVDILNKLRKDPTEATPNSNKGSR